ncbi:MAG: FAD-dependent oxidoreductase [bacterium]
MNKKVVILGGGVGGMSAAHELIERDFQVEVYERLAIPGGKARSMAVPTPHSPPWSTSAAKSKNSQKRPLPGEHGFRFFPGFYNHIIDTMKRIPYPNNKKGVLDNLVPATQFGFTQFGKEPIILKAQLPWSLKGMIKQVRKMLGADVDIPRDEAEFFAKRVWQLMTSCEDRRLAEYEQLGWWEYLEAHSKSADYQKFFAYGLTRTLVAAQADLASTFTVGDIFLQLLFDALDPTIDVDRLLDGPTNDVWIEPWLKYLKEAGVNYQLDAEVAKINCADGRIASVTIKQNGKSREVTGDYFISAMPVEAIAPLISQEMLTIDPTLKGITKLAPNVEWMIGLQIYLKRDIKLVHGHLNHVDSKWALTSISQRQFWADEFSFPDYGDGEVKGILSVDISDWETEGLNGKPALASTLDEIFEEVWKELQLSMIKDGEQILKDEDVHSFHLDPHIFQNDPDDPDPEKKHNDEPLLVNLINTWGIRPEAYTRIPNLFLASDYVRTNTDLATMEGANEAARRAVNSIIDAAGAHVRRCKIWRLHEPRLLGFWRENDQVRFDKGLPWKEKISLLIFLRPRFWYFFIEFLILRLWVWTRKLWLKRSIT